MHDIIRNGWPFYFMGRQSYRWRDTDFEANAKDGHGIDWPIRYNDLAPGTIMLKSLQVLAVHWKACHNCLMENLCLQYH
jgi:hypothetical protein